MRQDPKRSIEIPLANQDVQVGARSQLDVFGTIDKSLVAVRY